MRTLRASTVLLSLVLLLGTGFAIAQAAPTAGRAPDVIFVPTPDDVVDEMLTLAKVGPKDVVYDLGCGDGRIVIAAAKKGARAVGIDIDPERIKESKENATKAGVTDKVKFLQQDLFQSDISDATVVTLYLLNSLNLKLRPILMKQLRPGARVVSQTFDMGDWKPEAERDVNGRKVFLWIIPANGSGK